MVDFSELLQAAHGGDAVANIAQKFGISPDQANAALAALSPALAQGLQNHVQSPEGFSQILSHLSDPTHQAAYGDAAAVDAPQAATAGGDLLSQIFGGSANVGQIVQHIGQETGISPELLNQLAPVVASMTMGGVAKSLQEGGLGGLLQQVSGAASQSGGFGAIFGQIASSLGQNVQNAQTQGGQAAGQSAPAGGLGGVFGAVVGAIFSHTAPAGAAAAPAPAGLDPAITQAAISALSGLFQSGSASPGLQNVIGQILAKR
jgi:hypothetical protein